MSSLSPQPSPSPLKPDICPLPTCFVLTITSRGLFPSLRPIITHTVFYSYASASGRLIASFNQLKDNLDEAGLPRNCVMRINGWWDMSCEMQEGASRGCVGEKGGDWGLGVGWNEGMRKERL
jgi:hypothetical protein